MRDEKNNLNLKRCNIKDFEERVLSSGLCDFILPVNLMYNASSVIINYDASGYICLKDMDLLRLPDIFEILEKTLVNLKRVSEFLIDPERITLSAETIYRNMKFKDIKFIFVPKDEESIIVGILKLIRVMAEYAMLEDKRFIHATYNNIKTCNLSLDDMITFIGLKRREIYELWNGIIDKDEEV